MITLNFSVDDQLLTRTDENTVAANSHLVHVCEFAFSSEWDGRGKVATFKKRDLMLSVILDDDACTIPPEILQSENKIDVFELSVCGADGNSTITSTVVKVPILAGTWDVMSTEITPTMFEQIMAKIEEIEENELTIEDVNNAIEEYFEEHPDLGLNPAEVFNAITRSGLINLTPNYVDYTDGLEKTDTAAGVNYYVIAPGHIGPYDSMDYGCIMANTTGQAAAESIFTLVNTSYLPAGKYKLKNTWTLSAHDVEIVYSYINGDDNEVILATVDSEHEVVDFEITPEIITEGYRQRLYIRVKEGAEYGTPIYPLLTYGYVTDFDDVPNSYVRNNDELTQNVINLEDSTTNLQGRMLNVETGKQDKTQYAVMPAASADLLGKIYQYTGATNANYTQGHWYKCVENSGVYSWEDIGPNTPDITMTATVDNTTGTPTVSVTKTGTDAAPEFTFAFSGLKGAKGDTGNGIASIEKTATSGQVDTYTITYTNGTTSAFEVRNGDGSYDDTEVKAEIADANADIQKISDTFGTMAYEPLDLTLTLGKYARKDNGVLVNDSSMVMGYVELEVEPEQIYYITTNLSGNCAIVFYNNGVYVSDLNSLGAISDYQVTIPNNVNLMRISNRYASTTDTIVKGYVVSYAPFKAQVDDAFYDIETLQIQVNTLNDVIEHVKYPVYTDKTGDLVTDYIINYRTGAQAYASGAANTIIDVTPRETYRINCDLSGNTGIVGFDSNNVVTFGFNNVTGADYAISTGVYEVTIPNGTVKLGVSTRHQSSAPIGIYLKTYDFYDFADITETVDDLNFDAKILAERAYDIETRLRFSWKPFDKGKVIFMTDDTLSDIGVITSLLMNTYDFPMSYACITNTLENVVDANDNNYAKVKDVLVASQAYGGEVFSHSINSDDWGNNSNTNGGYNGYIPEAESDRRLRESKYTLSQYGLEANGFISPRGSDLRNYGYGVSKYYRYAYYQGTDIPQIFHFTRTNIKSLTLENLKAAIDNCASNHSLLVLMCHKVVDTNGEGYGIYPNGFTMADFTAIMDYLKWGTDETKTTPRTDLEVTSLKKVYAEYASIG